MKKFFILVLFVVGIYFLWNYSYLFSLESIELENYEPINEFQPSFTALNNAVECNECYDIEETVRIINGLEIAQSQSNDFYEYLEYMAKQDYSLVAKDIIVAKKKLLPILQKMFQLQNEYEELSDIWIIAKSAGAAFGAMCRNSNPVGVVAAAVAAQETGDYLRGVVNMGENLGINQAKTAAFDEYDRLHELKRSLSAEIDNIKMAYIEYLTEFTPIYNKYMKEWDRLCVRKDNAYLSIYSGRMIDAYNSIEEVIKEYPTNRELLLLKSLSLINIGSGYVNEPNDGEKTLTLLREVNLPDTIKTDKTNWNDFFIEADLTLDNYLSSYPEQSAPALLLKGLLYLRLGENSTAMSYCDQAAMEYPRQAARLTDLLDSYRIRTYLNKTPEGMYLLKLYRSTMEGYGVFSPNFLKAQYYAQIGDNKKSQIEIFNHFFRRGNQGIYDCLLSDMQYCENYLYNSFKQLLLERYYLDVSVKVCDGLFSSDDEIEVSINNRSDIDLENVRAFLCIHYTDMYTDEYDVIKIPTVNVIKHYEKKKLGTVKLNYEGKTAKDITRVRAIVITDDKICWVDDPDFKHVQAASYISSVIKCYSYTSPIALLGKQDFVKEFALDAYSVIESLTKGIKIIPPSKTDASILDKIITTITDAYSKPNNYLKIELPRILSFIDPTFSINEINDSNNTVLPVHNYLAGSVIRLEFDYSPKNNEVIPLYVYSSFMKLKIDIGYSNGNYSVNDIKLL